MASLIASRAAFAPTKSTVSRVSPKTPQAGEFELIARYFAPLARGFPGAVGLLDDAAYLKAEPGKDLVVTSDALVEGVHFLPDDPPELVARKALRVNLSDVAAKGAVPIAYLLDLVLPWGCDEPWVARFAAGLGTDQTEFGASLIGGDTAATPGPLTIAITAFGHVESGKMLRRGGAKLGDDIYVSGSVGDAALGLLVCRGGLGNLNAAQRSFLADRYRLPRPRTTLGPRLVDLAHAAIDVSDGLVADLGHICDTSAVGAEIDETLIPLSNAARAALKADGSHIVSILTGGDDYEILFTAPAAAADALADISRALDLDLTRIGLIKGGRGVVVKRADGTTRDLERGGWQHF